MTFAHDPPFIDYDLADANRIKAAWLNNLGGAIDNALAYIATLQAGVLSIKVNGTATTSQIVLNLLNGTNINITSDGAGGVTFTVTGVLVPADIGVSVEAYDATILKDADIGVSVQAYDAYTAKLNAVQSWTKAQRGTPVALTSAAASIAIDLDLANNFTHTLTENTTLAAPSNPVAGQSGILILTQHASAPKTLAYNAFWKFQGGTVPALTATNSAVDVLSYYIESATRATCNMLNDVK